MILLPVENALVSRDAYGIFGFIVSLDPVFISTRIAKSGIPRRESDSLCCVDDLLEDPYVTQ